MQLKLRDKDRWRDNDLAYVALKKGLLAYYSASVVQSQNGVVADINKRNNIRIGSYKELYFETMVYMSQFFELSIKNILSNLEGEGKFVDIHKKILKKVQKKEWVKFKSTKYYNVVDLSKNKYMKLPKEKCKQQIKEFYKKLLAVDVDNTWKCTYDECLSRLCILLNEKAIENGEKFEILVLNYDILKKLARYRNSVIHIGGIDLTHKELDEFMVIKILPLIEQLFSIDVYKKRKIKWQYRKLKNRLNPFEMLIDIGKEVTYNYTKVTMLKELIRASYNNPLTNIAIGRLTKSRENEIKTIAQNKAEYELEIANRGRMFSDIKDGLLECPVCGEKTIVRYWGRELIDSEEIQIENEVYQNREYDNIINVLKCACCEWTVVRGNINDTSTSELGLENYFEDV